MEKTNNTAGLVSCIRLRHVYEVGPHGPESSAPSIILRFQPTLNSDAFLRYLEYEAARIISTPRRVTSSIKFAGAHLYIWM